jgi:hypothetical protein
MIVAVVIYSDTKYLLAGFNQKSIDERSTSCPESTIALYEPPLFTLIDVLNFQFLLYSHDTTKC